MLYRSSGATDFDLRRQVAELRTVTDSAYDSRLLEEEHVGRPLP